MNDLDKQLQAYISGTNEELTSEDIENIRKKLRKETESPESGWTQNTIGFSLNEIRRE